MFFPHGFHPFTFSWVDQILCDLYDTISHPIFHPSLFDTIAGFFPSSPFLSSLCWLATSIGNAVAVVYAVAADTTAPVTLVLGFVLYPFVALYALWMRVYVHVALAVVVLLFLNNRLMVLASEKRKRAWRREEALQLEVSGRSYV